jgi:hypothetical protein
MIVYKLGRSCVLCVYGFCFYELYTSSILIVYVFYISSIWLSYEYCMMFICVYISKTPTQY